MGCSENRMGRLGRWHGFGATITKYYKLGELQTTERDSLTVLDLKVKVTVLIGPCAESLEIETFPNSSSLLVIPGVHWQSVTDCPWQSVTVCGLQLHYLISVSIIRCPYVAVFLWRHQSYWIPSSELIMPTLTWFLNQVTFWGTGALAHQPVFGGTWLSSKQQLYRVEFYCSPTSQGDMELVLRQCLGSSGTPTPLFRGTGCPVCREQLSLTLGCSGPQTLPPLVCAHGTQRHFNIIEKSHVHVEGWWLGRKGIREERKWSSFGAILLSHFYGNNQNIQWMNG